MADPLDDLAGEGCGEADGGSGTRAVVLKGIGRGYRTGEEHPKVELTDADVLGMRKLRERHRLSYREIGERFGVSIWTSRDICTYRTRASA